MLRLLAERIHRGRQAIALARQRGVDTSGREHHLFDLMQSAGREPTSEEGLEPWILWEWRRISIPEWQRILHESKQKGDIQREGYARWMLRDILLDPELEELEE